MSTLNIDDATLDSDITGVELIPVSDGSQPRTITTAALKSYVVDQIEAIVAASSVTGSDSVFVLQGGALKPADIDLIAQHAIDSIWAKADISTGAAGADALIIKDGGVSGVEKTITLTNLAAYILATIRTDVLDASTLGSAATLTDAHLATITQGTTPTKATLAVLAEYVRATIEAAILDVSNLGAAGTLVDADLIPVTQTTTGKKVALSVLASYIQAAIAASLEASILNLSSLTASAALADADLALVTQGSTGVKTTLSALATYVQTKIASALESSILDFSDLGVAAALADADMLAVTQTTTGKKVTLAVLAAYILAENAAANKLAALDVSTLDTATLTSADYLLVTQTTTPKKTTLGDLTTAIYAGLEDYVTALTLVTTPDDADIFYMIRSGVQYNVTLAKLKAVMGSTIAPATTTENKLAQWSSAQKTLKDGLTVQDTIRATGVAVDTAVPTEKAVRDAMTTALYGSYGELWIPATSMVSSVTAGAGDTAGEIYYWPESSVNSLTRACLIFDGSTQNESAEFDLVMPSDWDLGTVKFKALWAPAAGSTAADYVRMTLAVGLVGDNLSADAALGTAVEVVDQVATDEYLHVSPASGEITPSGTAALGMMAHFKLTRDYDYDGDGLGVAMTENLWLFGIQIQYQRGYEIAAW